MYNSKRALKDRNLIIMSVVSVIALTALAGSVMFSDHYASRNISKIASIKEPEDNLITPLTPDSSGQKADTGVTKETEVPHNNEEVINSDSAAQSGDFSGTTAATGTASDNTTAGNTASENIVSGNTPSESAVSIPDTYDEAAPDASVNAPASALSFTADSILVWPVETCDILIDYSMDTTTYFATLDMYKTSDAVAVRSEVGSPVYACADGIVTEHASNEEVGDYVITDLGNQYLLTYGQLKDVQVEVGNTVKKGDLIGYINDPTKYYVVEGPNLYLKLTKDGSPIDPLDFLDYEKP